MFAAALLVTIVKGIAVSMRTHAIDAVPDLVQRQVTANPNNDSVYFAALSGDGKQLAYTDLNGVSALKSAFVEGPDKVRIELVEGHAKKD